MDKLSKINAKPDNYGINIHRVDFLKLKERGFSNKKISKMIGVSIEKTDRFVKYQTDYKKYSGVF